MKILITGYTNRMFGSTKLRRDYVTFSFLLEDILKEMGHEVERKLVKFGDEVTYVYDYAFCGVAPLSSITAGRVPETHYVMDSLPGRHCIYADDWSFCGYGNSIRYSLKRWEDYLDYKKFPYTPEILADTKISLESLVTISNPWNNAPVLAPMFPWGDHDFLMRENYSAKLHTIDPSQWVRYPSISIPTKFNRTKQWVMAALSNHSSWVKKQRFGFPVVYVGNKNLGEILTEDQTIKLFANSFGVLSTGYPSAGSGWWRTRYLNAAWAETPIYSDYRDASIMGKSFQGSAQEFESEEGLSEYNIRVEGQRDWLNHNLGTKEQAMTVLEELIKK